MGKKVVVVSKDCNVCSVFKDEFKQDIEKGEFKVVDIESEEAKKYEQKVTHFPYIFDEEQGTEYGLKMDLETGKLSVEPKPKQGELLESEELENEEGEEKTEISCEMVKDISEDVDVVVAVVEEEKPEGKKIIEQLNSPRAKAVPVFIKKQELETDKECADIFEKMGKKTNTPFLMKKKELKEVKVEEVLEPEKKE